MSQTQNSRQPSGFAILTDIISLPVYYETLGTLSIQSGSETGVLDNTVIRTGPNDDDFAITGSSSKGATRSAIESILARVEAICIPMACAPKGDFEGSEAIAGRIKDCGETIRMAKRNQRRKDQSLPVSCPVCQIYGNTFQKGRVTCHDARVIGDPVQAMQRTHVALDRETGAQSPGALTTIETIPSGTWFKGTFGLTNILTEGTGESRKWMVGALVHVLKYVIPHLGLGAKKTAGYGEVNVEIGNPEFVLLPEEMDETPPEVFIRECLDEWYRKAKIKRPAEEITLYEPPRDSV